MAKLLNQSPAFLRWIITVLILLLRRNMATVRSEDEEHQRKLRLNDVTFRTSSGDNYVKIGEGSSLKVALFADLHFGENAWTEWGPQQDINSLKVMSTLLHIERPDFVIYLGDIITANNLAIENASLYWDKAISPTRAMNIPWASLFGNHDDAPFEWPIDWFSSTRIPHIQCPFANSSQRDECSFKGTTRLELIRHEIERNSLSKSQFGPKDLWPSVSNYVITVLSYKSECKLPVAFMYFLDSGGGSYPQVISNAQSEWFRSKSQEINPDSSVPEIIFWHIPSKAYKKAAKNNDRKCVGSMFEEDVAAQKAEMGMMKILEKRPSVKAVFVGHNHGLDWCCPYKKMWLCYARHTGYGGYGNWSRGARILEINHEPFSLTSWIQMEDGHSHSKVILSSEHVGKKILYSSQKRV